MVFGKCKPTVRSKVSSKVSRAAGPVIENLEGRRLMSATPVSLASAFNHIAIMRDGVATNAPGYDNSGDFYSGTLLGVTVSATSSVNFNGNAFTIGHSFANDVVLAQGQTIALPAAKDSGISFLASSYNIAGGQQNKTFKVSYTDGTSQTFTRSISDWTSSSAPYAGESIAVSMAYRNDGINGTQLPTTTKLYGYSLTLKSFRTVSSITLPNDSYIGVFAMDVMTATPLVLTVPNGTHTTEVSQSGTTLTVKTDGNAVNYITTGVSVVDIQAGTGANTLVVDAGTLPAILRGGTGPDLLSTGANNDTIYAGPGNTNVIAIGGTGNTLYAGNGYTNIWDTPGNHITARGPKTIIQHNIDKFMDKVSSALWNETSLFQPTVATGETMGWISTQEQNDPLFSTSGPSLADVKQGQAGTCYFLSALGSLTVSNPQAVQNLITPLGDGSYGVEFINNGTPYFVREDGWVPQSATNFLYAKLGVRNSSWVALMEKAWCYFHSWQEGKAASYSVVSGGLSGPTFSALGLTGVYSDTSVMTQFSSDQAMAQLISTDLAAGMPMAMGFSKDITGQVYGLHEYSVVSVVKSGGTITGIWVHNPWGVDLSTGIAAAGYNDGSNDGMVLVTPLQAWQDANELAGGMV